MDSVWALAPTLLLPAQYRLPDPATLLEFLRRLDGSLEKGKCAHTVPQGLLGTVWFLDIHAPNKPHVSDETSLYLWFYATFCCLKKGLLT